jgi:hypothetical protein
VYIIIGMNDDGDVAYGPYADEQAAMVAAYDANGVCEAEWRIVSLEPVEA